MRKLVSILLIIVASYPLFASKTQDTCYTSGLYMYYIKGPKEMSFYWDTNDTLNKVVFKDSIGIKNPNDTVWITWPDLPTIHTYKLSVTGYVDGCSAQPKTLTITVKPKTTVSIDSAVAFCKGDEHVFSVAGYNSVLWQNNSTSNTYTADSTQKVWVTVKNVFGCAASDTSNVIMNPLPVIKLHKDTFVCFGATLTLDAGNPGANYLWSDGSTGSKFTVEQYDTTIWVKVTDANSCVNVDTFTLQPCPFVFNPDKIPAAFTPNGDGNNDKWEIPGIEQYKSVVIEVYDRWGHLVFRSNPGYGAPWDGHSMSNGKPVPMDAYFYIINLKTKGMNPITGSVTVIR